MKIFGLNFDLWDTTLETKLQMLFAGVSYFLLIYAGPLSLIFCLGLLITPLWWLVLLYFLGIFYDKDTPAQGSRPMKWVQNLLIWKYSHDHFLNTLKLTRDFQLNSNQNYLFACFPHGVVPLGLYSTIVNSHSKFRNLYPNFRVKLAITPFLFVFPFTRELAMALDFISCSFKSLMRVLSKPEGGEIVVLFPGGALECSYNQYQPQFYKCVLNRRKGFVRVALKSGAALVPVLTFGENDLLTVENSFWQKFRFITERYQTFACGFVHGRGVFQSTFGMVPRRKPTMTVVGTPIATAKTENPSDAQVDALHKKFQEELEKLFEKYKHQFFDNPQDKCLEFV
ncbi:2-acylglycerol O-acyltransferase 1 [Tribolium castaneum]|uniref:2-acylglycerol O-acyltransferase 1 n=1 Tax=Tribolium castaneum TaxID=7070 RepID=UPI0001757D9E|nr:PREDICTED: 2-acylglycerol O-acyltransferase 1 [Tribolium castaneum]|eukprot:XP_975108.2 PREDICTED: 2-acylglycerol O-acyltransferase 1 [Tribolium castaneum]